MLDLLGDVGGLFDALLLIAHYLIAPFAGIALKSQLVTQFFGHVTDEKSSIEKRPEKIAKQSMLKNLQCLNW